MLKLKWLNWKFIVPLSISWRYLNFSNFPPKRVTENPHTKFKLTVYRHAGNSIQETTCKKSSSNRVSKMIQWVVTITLWKVNAQWLFVYIMSINFSCLFTVLAKIYPPIELSVVAVALNLIMTIHASVVCSINILGVCWLLLCLLVLASKQILWCYTMSQF